MKILKSLLVTALSAPGWLCVGWAVAWLTVGIHRGDLVFFGVASTGLVTTATALHLYHRERDFQVGIPAVVALVFSGILFHNVLEWFPHGRNQGVLTACKSNLKNYGTALDMYATDHEGLYPVRVAALTPNYLRSLPTCPAAAADTYSQSYRSTSEPEPDFILFCRGRHHDKQGVPENYPAYDPVTGLSQLP